MLYKVSTIKAGNLFEVASRRDVAFRCGQRPSHNPPSKQHLPTLAAALPAAVPPQSPAAGQQLIPQHCTTRTSISTSFFLSNSEAGTAGMHRSLWIEDSWNSVAALQALQCASRPPLPQPLCLQTCAAGLPQPHGPLELPGLLPSLLPSIKSYCLMLKPS
eukprot:1157924-Pelagomonas_calceolata.AAC.3